MKRLMQPIDRRMFLPVLAACATAVGRGAARAQAPLRIRIEIGSQALPVHLLDNPTTRDLLSLLPLELTGKDFMTSEKLAYLPRKLTTRDAPNSFTPVAGDFAYYAPWGNLALFHADGQPSPGLVLLGRFEGPVDVLRIKGEVTLRVVRERSTDR